MLLSGEIFVWVIFSSFRDGNSFNFFNKKVCHCIDDRHLYFSFLTHHKGKNT